MTGKINFRTMIKYMVKAVAILLIVVMTMAVMATSTWFESLVYILGWVFVCLIYKMDGNARAFGEEIVKLENFGVYIKRTKPSIKDVILVVAMFGVLLFVALMPQILEYFDLSIELNQHVKELIPLLITIAGGFACLEMHRMIESRKASTNILKGLLSQRFPLKESIDMANVAYMYGELFELREGVRDVYN